MRYRLLLFLLFTSLVSVAQKDRHVLLVSIDGFRPDFYLQEKWNAPTLKKLKASGVHAKGAVTVFPSVTYPSHTSIITGVHPAQHGIYYNAPYQGKKGAWYWNESYIKVETLWDAVKAAGLTSGAVMWPVTVGAPINYNFPVRRADNDEKTDQLTITRPLVTPKNLLDNIQASTGLLSAKSFSQDSIDFTIGKMSAYIVKQYKPNLMAVHFVGLDHAQHQNGRNNPKVQQALSIIDSMLNMVLLAYEQAGIKEKTDIIITGDHGFVSARNTIAPNTLLYKAGIITNKDWKARFHSTGGSAFLYLKDPNDQETVQKVKELLNSVPASEKAYFRIIDRKELDSMGVNPEVALAVSANNNSAFNGNTEGDFIKVKKNVTGSHGHDPRMKELRTGFIGFGPSFKNRTSIEEIHLVNISSVISDILGLNFKKIDPSLKNGLFKK
ncbi:hypothetical protein PIECOFPK_01988 [Mycovorax composti]|uniref:Alkaline phosphatase family protein n=1 Tax=Mycovorax composti TaxID=2962693 RepID=A0ABZ2EL55_9BACT